MANTNIVSRPLNSLPKRGPAWTFYAFTVLAILVAIATIVGIEHARIPYFW
jgi:hypothetical protein